MNKGNSNKGNIRKNFGPCIVCDNQEPNIQYRRITTQTILKVNNSPNIESQMMIYRKKNQIELIAFQFMKE